MALRMARELVLGMVSAAVVFPGLLSPPAWGQDAPARVAVLSSSGVDGDRRSWNEYDDRLNSLGWAFEKFANTELPSLLERSGEFDLILGTSLWNYGDPVDMTRHAAALREYMEAGGVLVLTDMSYGPMCDWLPALGEGLEIRASNANEELGADAQVDAGQKTPVLAVPHRIGGMNHWAHITQWGDAYTVLLRTKARTALMLGANIGSGALIVTTTVGLDGAGLENVWSAAQGLKDGLVVYPSLPETLPWPGELRGELLVENLLDSARVLTGPKGVIEGGAAADVAPGTATVPPHSQRAIAISLPLDERGEFVVQLALTPNVSITHTCTVGPLLTVRCNRTVLARGDELVVTARVSADELALEAATWHLSLRHEDRRVALADGPASAERAFRLPAADLDPGDWELAVSAEAGDERDEQLIPLRVVEVGGPPSPSRIGEHGELIVNGEPMLPLGTYHVGAGDLATLRDMGFNCATGPMFSGHAIEMDTGQRDWMDEAARLGIGAIQELSDYVRVPDRDFEHLRRMVSELRLHPATIAHYAVDEPSLGGLTPELISEMCAVIREADPDHPALVLDVPGAANAYAQCADIASTDPYPIGSAVPETLESVGSTVDALVAASGGRPVWVALQGHRQPPAGSANRYPTPAEVRCMSFLALNHGAKGLLYYAWGDAYAFEGQQWPSGFQFDEALRQGLPAVLAELQAVGPLYLLGEVTPVPAPAEAPAIDAVSIAREGATTVVAVNPTSRELRGTVIVDGREVALDLGPFEVRVIE